MKELLQAIKFNSLEESELAKKLSNWSYLHIYLTNITDEQYILKLIKYELLNNNRLQIILRLKTKYNRLRNEREQIELGVKKSI